MRIWLWQFLILLSVGFSISLKAEEVSDCWWSGCRVASQRDNFRARTLTITDPSYAHAGLPLPTHSKRPEADTGFIILECEPEKNLQEGDILLQVDPISKDPRHVYDLLMKSPHAAIVAKRPDGSLYALGTPRNYWPQGDLHHASYHVVRLREYPTEITSPKVLAEWKSSPVKYQKIRDWQEKRRVILAKIKKGIEFFEKNVPYYDSARNTQILDPKEKEKFTRWILGGETCDSVPSQYCSELVATIYGVAGAELPKVKSGQFYMDRLEKEVLPYFKKPGETDAEVFQRGVDAFFENREVWSNLGVDDDEQDAILRARKEKGDKKLLPKKVAELKANVEWVWSFPAFIRNGLLAWSGVTGNKGVITPLDFLDAVRDLKSDYSYVGTYLKTACEDPGKGPQTRHLID